MADCFYAGISIPARFIDEEIALRIETETGCKAEIKGLDEVLSFEDESAINGMFERLEDLLVKRCVPFDRASSGAYEFVPEERRFRPASICGMPGVDRTVLDAGQNGSPYIEIDEIEELVAMSPEEAHAKLKEHLTYLTFADVSDLKLWADGTLVPDLSVVAKEE